LSRISNSPFWLLAGYFVAGQNQGCVFLQRFFVFDEASQINLFINGIFRVNLIWPICCWAVSRSATAGEIVINQKTRISMDFPSFLVFN